MGFNLLSAAAGAVQGAAMGGNPLTIGAGALAGGFGGGSGATTVGGFSNGAQNLLNGGYLAGTEALNAQQLMFQLQLLVSGRSRGRDHVVPTASAGVQQHNSLIVQVFLRWVHAPSRAAVHDALTSRSDPLGPLGDCGASVVAENVAQGARERLGLAGVSGLAAEEAAVVAREHGRPLTKQLGGGHRGAPGEGVQRLLAHGDH